MKKLFSGLFLFCVFIYSGVDPASACGYEGEETFSINIDITGIK